LPESYRVFKLFDQTASVAAILQEVAGYLAIEGSMKLSQEELLVELKAVLLENRQLGKRVVLLVDDAEKMFPATMEGIIRTLTDTYGDGPRQELLQLVLFGTKEMETKMVSTTIEYFEDETNCQLYLEPLNIKDTADYLRFSLQLVAAGGGNYSTALLPYETIRKIHSLSHGNIAAINRLADRALRRAHADGASEISTKYL
jgi:general secretion pathway protein A